MTNEEQMQVLKEAIKSNYKGSLAELLQPQQQPQGSAMAYKTKAQQLIEKYS